MGEMTYDILYVDPPWAYRDTRGANRGLNHGGALFHYPTMTTKELMGLPVGDLANENCWLFCWATWPNMDVALQVIKAWGFRYITAAFVWVKTYGTTRDPRQDTVLGLGSYSRSNTEPVLLATRGRVHRMDAGVSQVVYAPRGRHSAKPPIVRDRIIKLAGDRSRIELFAREYTPGWDVWGNEVTPDVVLVDGEVKRELDGVDIG